MDKRIKPTHSEHVVNYTMIGIKLKEKKQKQKNYNRKKWIHYPDMTQVHFQKHFIIYFLLININNLGNFGSKNHHFFS